MEEARAVLLTMDSFKGKAWGLSQGLEPSVSITVDVMVPFDIVTKAVAAFEERFPAIDLHLSVEALGATVASVLEGRSVFALASKLALEFHGVVTEAFCSVPMCAVVSPSHALASSPILLIEDLGKYRQIMLADRSELTVGRQFGVLSSSAWRVSDLSAKLALLNAGLGWGAMPRDVVAQDLTHGTLVEIKIDDADPSWSVMPVYSTWQSSHPPGIEGRWLLDRLIAEVSEATTTSAQD